MRITDLEKKYLGIDEAEEKKKEVPKKETSREVNLSSEQVVNELKGDNKLARQKIEEMGESIKNHLKPLFAESFWKAKGEEIA